MSRPALSAVAVALLAVPLTAHALVYQFNARLTGAQENPPSASPAEGIATLFYDTRDTASLADDTYDFALSVFQLESAFADAHIHGAATPDENAPVRVSLTSAPFVTSLVGNAVLIGGDDVAAPALIPATLPSATNAGHPAMSFLELLRGQLAYINVHTTTFPAGATRGQLIEVAVVPEPATTALLLAGLGVLGAAARRRR